MRKRLLAVVITAAFQPAWAWTDAQNQSLDTFNVVAGAATTHDSNLFRAPPGQEVSDVVNSTTVGVKINKPYSLQQFVVDASFTDYRYRDNSYLNYTGKNISASWLWSLTPDFHGRLMKTRTDTLNSFNDYTATTDTARRNIRTSDTDRFDAEWGGLGQFHLVGGVAHVKQKNSQLFLQDDSYKADVTEGGVKYLFKSGTTLTALSRETDGQYERDADPAAALDSGFKQSEHELRLTWNLTGKSNINARVAHLKRTHDTFSERDFGGTVGSIDYTLKATDKLTFLFNARHDISNFQNVKNPLTSYSSYYVSDAYAISPAWALTEKTTIRASFGRESRDYKGTVVNDVPLRSETIKQSMLSVDWAAMRSLTLSASYQRQKRDSNTDIYDFNDRVLMFSANFLF